MQVLPDVLLFIALLTACTKNQEEAGKGCLNVKTELPLSSPQAHIVSTSKQGPLLSPKSSLLPRHPDLSRRIWNFFQSCEFCTPEISTWEQKGSKRTPSILWKGPGTWQAHLIFRLFILLSQVSSLPSPLPKRCPGPLNKMISEWLQYLHAIQTIPMYFLLF